MANNSTASKLSPSAFLTTSLTWLSKKTSLRQSHSSQNQQQRQQEKQRQRNKKILSEVGGSLDSPVGPLNMPKSRPKLEMASSVIVPNNSRSHSVSVQLSSESPLKDAHQTQLGESQKLRPRSASSSARAHHSLELDGNSQALRLSSPESNLLSATNLNRSFESNRRQHTTDNDSADPTPVKRSNSVAERLRKLFVRQPSIEILSPVGSQASVHSSNDDSCPKVFGCELEKLCAWYSAVQYEHSLDLQRQSNNVQENSYESHVPVIVQQCIGLLESLPHPTNTDQGMCALDCEGLYRISGNAHSIQRLVNLIEDEHRALDKKPSLFKKYDCLDDLREIHVITGTLKMFFRKLSQPLIPCALYDDFIDAYHNYENLDGRARMQRFRRLLNLLPVCYHCTLAKLLRHLLKVEKHSQHNRMSLTNLSTVFGPALMWPSTATTAFTTTSIASQRNHSCCQPTFTKSFLTVPFQSTALSKQPNAKPPTQLSSLPPPPIKSSSASTTPINIPNKPTPNTSVRQLSTDAGTCVDRRYGSQPSSSTTTAGVLRSSSETTCCSMDYSHSPPQQLPPLLHNNPTTTTTTKRITRGQSISVDEVASDMVCQNHIIEFLLNNFDSLFS